MIRSIYTAFAPWDKEFHREADMLPNPETFGYEHGDQDDTETMLPTAEEEITKERLRIVYAE